VIHDPATAQAQDEITDNPHVGSKVNYLPEFTFLKQSVHVLIWIPRL